jgi:ribosomal protein S18 acetylase RimI-like enzyme
MKIPSQLEVLDLRHFSARQLRSLLDEESRVWSARLRWDYRSSADLLLQYLDSRVLPGFVALDHGRICGYVFCVYEGSKSVVGDVYASTATSISQPAVEVERILLMHILELLQNSPNVERIESQLLLHPAGEISAPFVRAGFQIHQRLFMECDLSDGRFLSEAQSDHALPGGLRLAAWSSTNFQQAGGLVHKAYSGHLDSEINDQYRSLDGALRFLHNIVRFPGCGVFDVDASSVILREGTDEMAAMLLCSRVREEVAHITQICVLPEYRKQGLGRMLLAHCAAQLTKRRFDAITLTVTAGNTHAVALYEQLGFTVRHRFDALVWTGSTDI